ncbi:ROK family transcriptional regulator [Novosphingobium sp. AP12]|uniref:ROK family transcriptional regulator n=1 Tax=Novosphingobium sp. AP12 TaxID=1144305 RepID=UPI000271D845|nr:ROK family transcriptional regulator [Novosphingobium sp. AP12]EJL35117.1 transcriptional regulator/sugar kinase [Novosphingobium sp. AP12]
MDTIEHDASQVRLLKHVRRAGAISRVELVQVSGLSKGTVTELTADLVRRGVLAEMPGAASARGRPRIDLRIVAGAAYAAALIPLSDGLVSLDVIDLNGDRVYSERGDLGDPGIDRLADRAAALIDGAIGRSGVPRRLLRHAAIVLPAQVDRHRGVVHWMPQHGWHEPEAIGPRVAERLGLPVTVDNRASVVARAEHWFGKGDIADDFSCIALLERGMGAARYRGGLLQTGTHGMNSEFAHVKVAFEGGRPCFCGGSGCLAAYASVMGMLRHAGGGGTARSNDSFADLVARARAGQADARRLFETAGRALGTAVAGHINENDPGRVLIVTAVAAMPDLIGPDFRAALCDQTLRTLLPRTSVEFRSIAEEDYWKGAASLALEELYRHAPAS